MLACSSNQSGTLTAKPTLYAPVAILLALIPGIHATCGGKVTGANAALLLKLSPADTETFKTDLRASLLAHWLAAEAGAGVAI